MKDFADFSGITRWRRLRVLALLALPVGSGFAQENLAGIASVIDGDMIEIHDVRVRLRGAGLAQVGVNRTGSRPIQDFGIHCRLTSRAYFLDLRNLFSLIEAKGLEKGNGHA